MPDILTDVVE